MDDDWGYPYDSGNTHKLMEQRVRKTGRPEMPSMQRDHLQIFVRQPFRKPPMPWTAKGSSWKIAWRSRQG